MPRYYFDIETDGTVEPDQEGVAIGDADGARREAVKALYAVAGELDPQLRPWTLRSRVRDETNAVIFEAELAFSVH